LRCVVFHHISPTDSPFTSGINVTTTPGKFEAALAFLTRYYTPVSLEDVLTECEGRGLPSRAVLVTFDDAYASVVKVAAPLCQKYRVPAVFFVNAAFLDNQRLAPDNLVCYVANVHGMATINKAARTLQRQDIPQMLSVREVFGSFFPSITLVEREAFLEALTHLSGISERRLAEKSALYLSTKQLCTLGSYDFEIGNHTYTHVHCRSLLRQDFDKEIRRNKGELESISGTRVRSFSQPYGSSKDLTAELVGYLRGAGHEAVFLSESVANLRGADPWHLDRVNARADRDDTLFLDLEVLPRLRAVRNRVFRYYRPIRADRNFHSMVN
jgi:peptidoglycan/xylan/chitin deacetylase (PgdA/CDA1 family)